MDEFYENTFMDPLIKINFSNVYWGNTKINKKDIG